MVSNGLNDKIEHLLHSAQSESTDWAAIYQTLHLEVVRASGKWMLNGLLITGIILTGLSFILFQRQRLISVMLAVGFLVFASKYAFGLWRMSKNPTVYRGIIISKPKNSRTNDTTFEEYTDFYLKIQVTTAFEINKNGYYKKIPEKTGKWACPENIYRQVQQGDTVTVIVTPHDRSIAKIIN